MQHQPKPLLVLLHGWGQSQHIWYQTNVHQHFLMQTFNLPGHGGQEDVAEALWLPTLAEQIRYVAAGREVVLLGWSLGGQLAIQLHDLLRHNILLKGLVLVSSTPCFRQQKDKAKAWLWGCDDAVWADFERLAMAQDTRLMQRFFQMMLLGDDLTRREVRMFAKAAVDSCHPPSVEGLTAGLHLLSHLDMRQSLANIDVPTLVMHGEQDVIVPVQAGRYLAEHIPLAESFVFQGCGHAPFLTQSGAFNRELERWWKNISM